MIFSKKCQYAIRSLTHLADARQVCDVREISQRQKVPYHFMAKILQGLNREGFVKSVKGAGGGFLLARPAGRIRLIDVLAVIDGNDVFSRCLYGLQECSASMPCPMHQDWKVVRYDVERYLRSHTIADLVDKKSAKRPTWWQNPDENRVRQGQRR
ncbi:MAG: Rrf2 family transcriptional regulator [Acidobacteria bacterium]|nr:Rrf2 family transcriptional regulator [Acidobacteriota bacterium]